VVDRLIRNFGRLSKLHVELNSTIQDILNSFAALCILFREFSILGALFLCQHLPLDSRPLSPLPWQTLQNFSAYSFVHGSLGLSHLADSCLQARLYAHWPYVQCCSPRRDDCSVLHLSHHLQEVGQPISSSEKSSNVWSNPSRDRVWVKAFVSLPVHIFV
jgi:hypothetical protein